MNEGELVDGTLLIINEPPPWWRRVACAIGWHQVYRARWVVPLGGWLLRCRYCGSDDMEWDWIGITCSK